MEIIDDISIIPERVRRELIRGENARAEFAIRAQTALAEAMGALGPTRHIEGIGRKVATIHPELAARIRVKYGSSCLHDPQFLHRLVKENPFLKAPCVPAALTLRVDGLRDSRRSEAGEEFQNGKGNGARRVSDGSALQGDPATPSNCHASRVSCLIPGQRSGHETPARSGFAVGARRLSAAATAIEDEDEHEQEAKTCV